MIYIVQAEGIFRINAENSQEEYVRDQLNMGIVPDGIDVHCLAGLIKVYRLILDENFDVFITDARYEDFFHKQF